ncbi:MAG TPA: PEP-CTERM sorting domain-containing protein [Terriglobia bacterium]|nr:PEP-CTERM sorting domain-containing protein [Terriglobia bacterium]
MARVRRRRQRHHWRALLPIGATVLIVFLMVFYHDHQRHAAFADLQNVTASYDNRDLFRGQLGLSEQSRVIYPYSVIPWGAQAKRHVAANRRQVHVSKFRPPQVAPLESPIPERFPSVGQFPGPPLAELPLLPAHLPSPLNGWRTSVPPAASGPGVPPFALFLSSGDLPPSKKPPQAPSPVPEPGTLWLLSSAVGVFALYVKRRNKRHPEG